MIGVASHHTSRARCSAVAMCVMLNLVTASARANTVELNGQSSDKTLVVPGHVYANVQQFAADLEHLRLVMGKPQVGDPLFAIRDAAPKHVLEMARSLLRKTNVCAEAFDLDAAPTPARLDRDATPADVLNLVQSAHQQLVGVCGALRIKRKPKVFLVDVTRTPSDVIALVLRCNRQLNLMIEEPVAPRDVYAQVTLAIGYVRCIASVPADHPVSERSAFVPHQRPADVYGRLRETDRLIATLGRSVGIETPSLNFHYAADTRIAPSDVHDLAVLTVTNLRDIRLAITGDSTSLGALHFPGPRFPSHVYQRVGTLNALVIDVADALQTKTAAAETQP